MVNVSFWCIIKALLPMICLWSDWSVFGRINKFCFKFWLVHFIVCVHCRAVFNWVLKNQNQSNYSGQSQRTQSNPLSNQNSKKLHKTRENLCKQVTIGFGFACNWFWFYFRLVKKVAQGFKPITEHGNSKTKVNANYYWHSSENHSTITLVLVLQHSVGHVLNKQGTGYEYSISI